MWLLHAFHPTPHPRPIWQGGNGVKCLRKSLIAKIMWTLIFP